MTPEEKAKELVNKIYQPMGSLNGLLMNSNDMWQWAKERAIESASLLIKELNGIPKYATCNKFEYKKEFWSAVKTEIEKL